MYDNSLSQRARRLVSIQDIIPERLEVFDAGQNGVHVYILFIVLAKMITDSSQPRLGTVCRNDNKLAESYQHGTNDHLQSGWLLGISGMDRFPTMRS